MDSYIKKIDITLIISVFGLVFLGLIALYSSSHTVMTEGGETNYFVKQIIWVILGAGVVVTLYFIPNRLIYESAYIVYAISLFLLLLVIFFGKIGYGAERWLRFGPVALQPSEFAKIATVLAVARYVSQDNIDLNRLKDFLLTSLFIFAPFLLVVRQPDLGTALVFAAMALPIYYWSGLKIGNLFLIIIPGLVMFASFYFYAFLLLMIILIVYLIYSNRSKLVIAFNFIANIFMGLITPVLWNNLKPYQQNRIKVFLNPEVDPRGSGYQIIQSKVAIGSGGFSGKGFMEGSQTQLRFLPEQHTDFIYAVIGEEFGFIGVMLGLILFYVLLMRAVRISSIVKSRFSSIVGIGIVTIIAFHVFVNIGMTIGFLPVTGLPLPFLSYGGSSMLTNMIMVGILLNLYKNRFEY